MDASVHTVLKTGFVLTPLIEKGAQFQIFIYSKPVDGGYLRLSSGNYIKVYDPEG